MRERPILMSAPMVRAILARTKTQTRRVVKWPSVLSQSDGRKRRVFTCNDVPEMNELLRHRQESPLRRMCPYGEVGGKLWVRETWMDLRGTGIEPFTAARTHYAYGADTPPGSYGDECRKEYGLKWRPSIHMPRLACRIVLEIADVRVERLQEISEADAMAEGITHSTLNDPRVEYRWLWESINGPGSWDLNPYVWAITFRRIGDA